MMAWDVEYLKDAVRDMERLDGSQLLLVRKAIKKVSMNPLPQSEGGYGKPLGNKAGHNLSGLLKIKLKSSGIRIVYSLLRKDGKMVIIVIGIRADNEVYDLAASRTLE